MMEEMKKILILKHKKNLPVILKGFFSLKFVLIKKQNVPTYPLIC